MRQKEYIKRIFNKVDGITAICCSDISWTRGEYPELEIGKTYQVSHIGVLSSFSNIMLKGLERRYDAGCFDLYEYGRELKDSYTSDPRFWAPYLREQYRKDDSQYLAEQIEEISIPAHLANIEKEYDVKILLAVESGNRAWGFESKNSDWDVRFIYVHKPEWYFKVEEQRDVIEHMYEDDVDLAGWELRKALSLLRRSNPSLLEWFNSPKIYYVNEEFAKRIHTVEQEFFNPIRMMYHYNHIYKKHNERYLQQEGYPMKRFLYYLRGILACKWIEKNNTLPPVSFTELLNATVEEKHIKDKVEELILIKKGEKECDMLIVDDALVQYAKQWADYYNETIGSFRPDQHSNSADSLDAILYDMVNSHQA